MKVLFSKSIALTRDNNLWIGAWWTGFVVAFLVSLIIAVPIAAFPPVLPGKLRE